MVTLRNRLNTGLLFHDHTTYDTTYDIQKQLRLIINRSCSCVASTLFMIMLTFAKRKRSIFIILFIKIFSKFRLDSDFLRIYSDLE